MRKEEVEESIKQLKELKSFSDRQVYNISAPINQKLIKVIPLLEDELERMSETKVEINCPAILIVETSSIKKDKSLTDFINDKLQELVLNNYRIIDYGLMNNQDKLLIYIKYTS